MSRVALTRARERLPTADVLRKIRIPYVHRATLRQNGREEDVFIVDVGMQGIFIERAEALPIGDRVEVHFCLTGNEIPVHAVCRVAWWHAPSVKLKSKTLPVGIGIEFVELSDWDRRRVRNYVEEHLDSQNRNRRFHPEWPPPEEPEEPR